jgi:hypothetical protein
VSESGSSVQSPHLPNLETEDDEYQCGENQGRADRVHSGFLPAGTHLMAGLPGADQLLDRQGNGLGDRAHFFRSALPPGRVTSAVRTSLMTRPFAGRKTTRPRVSRLLCERVRSSGAEVNPSPRLAVTVDVPARRWVLTPTRGARRGRGAFRRGASLTLLSSGEAGPQPAAPRRPLRLGPLNGLSTRDSPTDKRFRAGIARFSSAIEG